MTRNMPIRASGCAADDLVTGGVVLGSYPLSVRRCDGSALLSAASSVLCFLLTYSSYHWLSLASSSSAAAMCSRLGTLPCLMNGQVLVGVDGTGAGLSGLFGSFAGLVSSGAGLAGLSNSPAWLVSISTPTVAVGIARATSGTLKIR